MRRTRNLYVMISRTDTYIGSIIRTFCRYPYCHVSITLDESLRSWYSFVRYHHDFPFYSGFTREPVERFLAKGKITPVRIFRIKIPELKAKKLEHLFSYAGRRDTGLMYNYYDALASWLGQKVEIPGAYTCLGFACTVLDKDYVRIEDLNEDLSPMLYYDGDLAALTPDSGSREDPYFSEVGFFRGAGRGILQFSELTLRFMRHNVADLVQQRLHTPT